MPPLPAFGLSREHIPLRHEVVKLAASVRIPLVEASTIDEGKAAGSGLTAQETNVLLLLSAGLTNAEIGTALFISPKTASVHVSHLIRKLNVSNRTEAAACGCTARHHSGHLNQPKR